ncbi:TetR/AcrR family transcriptional regulator [Bradyrhizobium viridifuturi]|uniref:TetR/AcrR family transcriptional regulator n=1 Tax=Bradyrhizobium viridifuturi TaxID=1654716 RepID=UPI00067E9A96|nr:TetR/AcrR family transcriptional regulator [Bradyrhizobium viridifuturi]
MGATSLGTRDRLLAAAQQELIEGHGHLEMQAVAKRARVSVGLAYHHFGSKAGLIAAVVEDFYQRLDEARSAAPSCPPPVGRTGRRRGSASMSPSTMSTHSRRS